jgi:hypothetical protein
MEIEELFDAYGVPEGNSDAELTPDYAGLYKAIQTKKVAPTARVLFRDEAGGKDGEELEEEDDPLANDELYPMGRLEGQGVNDSVSEVPLNIAITGFQVHEKLSFSEEESMFFVERKDAEGPGVIAKLALADDGRHSGIVSGLHGEIKLVRAWGSRKDMELFEGMLSLDVHFERKIGKEEELTRMAVWAVRSAEKNGDEDEDENEEDHDWDLWQPCYPGETVTRIVL